MASFRDIVENINERPLHIKIAVLIIIVFLISCAYWYFLWSPKAEELKRARLNLQTRERKLREYEAIARELPKFEMEFERLNKEFEIAALKLPKEKEIPALIDSVYGAVSASGLEPITFVPKGEVRKDIYAEIPIEMKVFGSYFDLANFFDRISRLPRIVNVRNLSLNRDDARSGGNNVVLDVEFTTVTFRVLPISSEQLEEKGEGERKSRGKERG